MKKLIDGIEVSARSYYFLLDWNEQDEHKTLIETFSKMRLCDLNIDQYTQLFNHATQKEGIYLAKKIKP
jgi:hypothetical protein